jgi:hypothetical protein
MLKLGDRVALNTIEDKNISLATATVVDTRPVLTVETVTEPAGAFRVEKVATLAVIVFVDTLKEDTFPAVIFVATIFPPRMLDTETSGVDMLPAAKKLVEIVEKLITLSVEKLPIVALIRPVLKVDVLMLFVDIEVAKILGVTTLPVDTKDVGAVALMLAENIVPAMRSVVCVVTANMFGAVKLDTNA